MLRICVKCLHTQDVREGTTILCPQCCKKCKIFLLRTVTQLKSKVKEFTKKRYDDAANEFRFAILKLKEKIKNEIANHGTTPTMVNQHRGERATNPDIRSTISVDIRPLPTKGGLDDSVRSDVHPKHNVRKFRRVVREPHNNVVESGTSIIKKRKIRTT